MPYLGSDIRKLTECVTTDTHAEAKCFRGSAGICKAGKELAVKVSWFLIWPVLLLGGLQQAGAQNADLAGVLRGDRWEYEVTDEITGDVTQATSVFVDLGFGQ